jgi:pilus assembly protein CpaC
VYGYDINQKVLTQDQFENKTVYLPLNNYRVLEFNKRVKKIQLTNSSSISAEFLDNNNKPLMVLKVLGKAVGNESALVSFDDNSSIQINFNIMKNLDSIITIAKSSYPNLIVEQANDTIVLKGKVKDYKEKAIVLDIFKKASIDLDKQLVDMIETSTPSRMIRVKLYVVEISNDRGKDIKNNWMVSSKNYMQATDPSSKLLYNVPSSDANNVNAQRNFELDNTLNTLMSGAVSLSGGLTGMANYLGKYFNVGLTLNYLASEGVANVLDETTLLTLENKEAIFHAGGTIRLKTQAISATGVPVTVIEKVKYGLQLEIKAKNIMDNKYVDLEIKTSSTDIDWKNQVDGIPSFREKEIITNVLVKDKSTVVLGGLLNNNNSNDIDKIPALGDVPVLGALFRSKSFKAGKSELVFFITPEVVDPKVNNQVERYKNKRKLMLDTTKYEDKDKTIIKDDNKKEKEVKSKNLLDLFN